MIYALLLAVLLVLAAGVNIYRSWRRRTLPCRCRTATMQSLTTFGRQVTCPHGWWWSEHPDTPSVLVGAPRRRLG